MDLRARDRELSEIAKSIASLAELFKDLSALVIDQGTLLDSVEYNIEQTAVQMSEAVKELNVATRYVSVLCGLTADHMNIDSSYRDCIQISEEHGTTEMHFSPAPHHIRSYSCAHIQASTTFLATTNIGFVSSITITICLARNGFCYYDTGKADISTKTTSHMTDDPSFGYLLLYLWIIHICTARNLGPHCYCFFFVSNSKSLSVNPTSTLQGPGREATTADDISSACLNPVFYDRERSSRCVNSV